MKKEKPVPKPAKIFRKPIPEAAFKKRYVKYIDQADDKAFLSSCFGLSEGSYRLKDGLDRAGMRRLNALGKAIAGNRGFLNSTPLILISILAIGLAVFGVFFMNPLLERAAEAGLSAAFQARTEISGFRLRVFGMGISLNSLQIADRDAPMTNLIECGAMRLKLDPAAILRARVRITEARADSMAFGTPRKTSGALPEYPAKPDETESGAETKPPLVDFAAFDAEALLEREKDKLASAALYQELGASYARMTEEWSGRVEASNKSVEDLRASSQRLRTLDVKKIKTVDEAQRALADLTTVKDSASTVIGGAKDAAAGLTKDMGAAKALEKSARAALEKDSAYLKRLIDPGSGAAFQALEPTIRAMLSDSGEKYLNYGLRALEVLDSLLPKGGGSGDGKKAGTEEKKKPGNLKGRDYPFPARAYPAFWLCRLDTSFNDGSRDWVISISDVSTDPDLTGAPSRLEVSVKSGDFAVEAKGMADMRSEATEAFALSVNGGGIPVDVREGLSNAGISSFAGTLSGVIEAKGGKDGSMDLAADLAIGRPVIGGASGTLAEAVAEGVKRTGSVELDVGYVKPDEGADSFTVKTNLDRIISEVLSAITGRYAASAAAELDAAVKKYGGEELSKALGGKEAVDALLSSALNGQSGAADIKKVLDAKTKEIEARIAELGAGLLKGLKPPGF